MLPRSFIKPTLPARAFARLPFGGTFGFKAYKTLVCFVQPRTTAKTYFGADLTVDRRDLIQACIAYFGTWEPDLSAVFSDVVQQGDVVVDVGANIGYYSLLASRLTGPTGSVVAIEASPRIAAILRRHVEDNEAANVRVLNVAASDQAGQLALFDGPPKNAGQTTTVAARGLKQTGVVPALPLHTILTDAERSRVSLIKIDVEGAEIPVLKEILASLAAYPRRLSILVEASPNEGFAAWDRIFDDFVGHGFSAAAIANEYDYGWYLRWRARTPRVALSKLPRRQTDILFTRV